MERDIDCDDTETMLAVCTGLTRAGFTFTSYPSGGGWRVRLTGGF